MSLHPGSCLLRIDRLRWPDGRPIRNATTVLCSVLDSAGAALTGADAVACTVQLVTDPADDGVYEGYTSTAFAPTIDTEYTVRFTITVDSKTQTVDRSEVATRNLSDA